MTENAPKNITARLNGNMLRFIYHGDPAIDWKATKTKLKTYQENPVKKAQSLIFHEGKKPVEFFVQPPSAKVLARIVADKGVYEEKQEDGTMVARCHNPVNADDNEGSLLFAMALFMENLARHAIVDIAGIDFEGEIREKDRYRIRKLKDSTLDLVEDAVGSDAVSWVGAQVYELVAVEKN